VVSVQYDAGLVDVESADGKEAVSPGLRHKVRLGEGALRALAYRVRPRGDGPQTTEVVVSIAAAGQTASHRLDVRIPAPETVELSITGPAFAVDRPLDATDHLRLLLFPNRVTPFRFALVNRSGRARKTRVELWSRPASTAVTGDRVLPVDALGSVRPGFERLFGPLDVELPADPTPVTLPFPPPPAGEPAKPAPAKKDASPPESPEAVDKRPIVTPGLVCLVADAANPERQWNTWIDFALRPPRDYLEPDVAYDPIQQQITIAMHPRDADGDGKPDLDRLPPTAAAEPIRLIWNTAGVLEPGTEMKDQAELAPPSYTAALFAKVPAQADKQIPVQLAVDGYPRAFLYNVRCDRIGRPAERERSPCRIRITSPAAGAAFLAPLEVIPVEFQVDAPEDAFQKPGDTVEIGLDENGDRTLRNERKLQWSSDRQVTVRLHKVEPTGNAQFHAEVTDFKTLLPAAGLRNKVVAVLARVNVSQPGTSQGHASDQDEITTVLDGAPPVVRVETPVRPVMVGEEIPVTVLAEDLSGVAKVRVGLDLDASGDLEEAEKPLLLSQPSSSGAWSTALATKDLPPGRYTLVALATDRVGLATKERSVVTLAAPRKPSVAEKKAADTSTIQGRVVLISRPASGIRVTLEGLNRTATSDDKGRFTFRDVPPGSYKLEAKGAALNRFRSGSANVTVPGGGQTVTVDVQIE
jgi:hypothetical protein